MQNIRKLHCISIQRPLNYKYPASSKSPDQVYPTQGVYLTGIVKMWSLSYNNSYPLRVSNYTDISVAITDTLVCRNTRLHVKETRSQAHVSRFKGHVVAHPWCTGCPVALGCSRGRCSSGTPAARDRHWRRSSADCPRRVPAERRGCSSACSSDSADCGGCRSCSCC